jgi:fumarate reductase flavoprotein subunit
MAPWVRRSGAFHEPDAAAIEQAVARARAPLGKPAGDLNAIREKLYDVMWDDVGIVRDAASLQRAQGALDELEARLDATGVEAGSLAFNLTWHDWLNLKSLLLVSKSIRAAAVARDDSRGAHFRSDFPEVRDLERSSYTCVMWSEGAFGVAMRPVEFTRVKPGETLLEEATAA